MTRLTRLLACALLFAGAAIAQEAPISLVYQGALSDLAGAPIDGERAITFRLHAGPEDDDALWTERLPAVDVVNGRFTTSLGLRTPIPAELATAETLFLAVQIDGDSELQPRMPVGAALRAQWANRAGQADDVEGRHIHPSAVSIGDLAVIDEAGRWVGPRDGFGGAGPQGEPGPQGDPGPQGPVGPQGPAGSQGDPGVAGPAGPEGAAGPAGPAGPQGAPGDPGPAGPQGVAGPAGPQGENGPAGPIGPRGEAGPEGPAGPAGVAGPAGADGPRGDVGPIGPAGPAGPAPAHEWSGTQLRFTGPDGQPGDWVDLMGPAGPAGAPGVQGPAGPAGPAGIAGAEGAAGPRGPQGDPGPAGAQGDRGPAGPQGDPGPQGVAGPAGPQGAQGQQGPRGLPADPADFTRDTDQDGFPDWIEVAAGTDFDDINSRPADADNDGIADFFGGQPAGGGDAGGAPKRYLDIAAGETATCALGLDGDLICWGQGVYGEATPPDGEFTQIAMSERYACGLRADREVRCWGGVDVRAHVDPPAGPFIFVDAGDDGACGLRPGGAVDCWGRMSDPPADAGPFVQIDAGRFTTCGIREDDTAVCWGSNQFDQAEPPIGVPFLAIAAGYETSCGIRADTGLITCWGDSRDDDTGDEPPGGTYVGLDMNWEFISTGCAWRADGTLRCWAGRPGGVYPARPVGKISVGVNHACALYLDGEAYCWGSDSSGQSTVP